MFNSQKFVVVTSNTIGAEQAGAAFREATEAGRSSKASRLAEFGANVAGNSDLTGYYTPELDQATLFSHGVSTEPALLIGSRVLNFGGGAKGRGVDLHLAVWEEHEQSRIRVEGLSDMMTSRKSGRLVADILERLRRLDADLTVVDSNI